MTTLASELEVQVRRAEPDLWLASRLVSDAQTRATLIALYAVHIELSKVAGAASSPLAGEIRLAWWREEVEALFSGARALGHPALEALRGVWGLDHNALETMIEARHAELEHRPFADEAALVRHIDGVDGGLMRASVRLIDPDAETALVAVPRAWGWARLFRERRLWSVRGRDWTPTSWADATDAEIAAHVLHRVTAALHDSTTETRDLSVAAFPAVVYATLARSYPLGRSPSELEKRARLLWASIRGRL